MRLNPTVPQICRFMILTMAVVLVASSTPAQHELARPGRKVPDSVSFYQWLTGLERTDGVVAGLYPYFDGGGPEGPLSPIVSAKCVLFWLEVGRTAQAKRAMERLLYWQRVERGAHPRTDGALPSEIVWDSGHWVHGPRYYSADNLVVMEAFLRMWKATRDDDFYLAAQRIARWLRDVMCRGDRYGVWNEDHGAPMRFVTANGDFDNRIFTNVELLWLPALRRFAVASGDTTYRERFERARNFLLSGQSDLGPWYDHYDPGYPPQPYAQERWNWYDPSGLVVADNTARAALGAYRVGAIDRARRFADWLQPENGAVPAYLDVETGRGRFVPGDEPYYDVVVSGLWRTLAVKTGNGIEARSARRFLSGVQDDDGGWFWGLKRRGLHPVEYRKAIITGIWAVSDLTMDRY